MGITLLYRHFPFVAQWMYLMVMAVTNSLPYVTWFSDVAKCLRYPNRLFLDHRPGLWFRLADYVEEHHSYEKNNCKDNPDDCPLRWCVIWGQERYKERENQNSQ